MEDENYDLSQQEASAAMVEIDSYEKLAKSYKSIYYMMNAKPDSMTRAFDSCIRVDIDSLKDLNERVVDKIRMHYQDDGLICTVKVKFDKRQAKSFDCWQTFENYAWKENEPIQDIFIKWDFNIRLPQYKLPQRHALSVKLTSEMKIEEVMNLVFSGNVENLNEVDEKMCTVVSRVDFINVRLGEELLDIVEGWVKSVKCDIQDNVIIKFVNKHSVILKIFFNYFTTIVFLLCGVILLNKLASPYFDKELSDILVSQVFQIVELSCAICFIAFLIHLIFCNMGKKVIRMIEKYGHDHIFNITVGDKKKIEKIEKINYDLLRDIVVNIIATVIVNLWWIICIWIYKFF